MLFSPCSRFCMVVVVVAAVAVVVVVVAVHSSEYDNDCAVE